MHLKILSTFRSLSSSKLSSYINGLGTTWGPPKIWVMIINLFTLHVFLSKTKYIMILCDYIRWVDKSIILLMYYISVCLLIVIKFFKQSVLSPKSKTKRGKPRSEAIYEFWWTYSSSLTVSDWSKFEFQSDINFVIKKFENPGFNRS